MIVAANVDAYREYSEFSAYTCQAGRTFAQDPRWMGFYADGVIKPEIPEITFVRDHVPFTRAEVERLASHEDPVAVQLAKLIPALIATSRREWGDEYKIVLLTPRSDDRTFVLKHPIKNVERDHSGRPTPFTQFQRYTRMDWLHNHPTTTADLGATPDEGSAPAAGS